MRGSAISFMTQASVALKDSFLGFLRKHAPHDATKAGEIQFNLEQVSFKRRPDKCAQLFQRLSEFGHSWLSQGRMLHGSIY
jgi:hypothetical protein